MDNPQSPSENQQVLWDHDLKVRFWSIEMYEECGYEVACRVEAHERVTLMFSIVFVVHKRQITKYYSSVIRKSFLGVILLRQRFLDTKLPYVRLTAKLCWLYLLRSDWFRIETFLAKSYICGILWTEALTPNFFHLESSFYFFTFGFGSVYCSWVHNFFQVCIILYYLFSSLLTSTSLLLLGRGSWLAIFLLEVEL